MAANGAIICAPEGKCNTAEQWGWLLLKKHDMNRNMATSSHHAGKLNQLAIKSNASSDNSSPATHAGILYVVATPIGNLKDMTFRAVEVLKSVDVIACEDTRQSRKLMQHYDIRVPLVSYHEHNHKSRDEALIALMQQGKHIAVISDAGTPVISDPGASLVQQAHAAGIRVSPIPGASAVISAVSVCGLEAADFFMAGFLPAKGKPRKQAIQKLVHIPGNIVLYEAPHRLVQTLRDLAEALGDRLAFLAREITKMHESFYHGTLSELASLFEEKGVKGECVLVVSPAPIQTVTAEDWDEETITTLLRDALSQMPAPKAAARIAEKTGLPRKTLYARAVALKAGGDAA